ncbi:hypothetical protein BJX61DRAFT_546310 [Aspergillus egyptiacus]|nr:hypothetical protein BJX61DRAFT_546310 [Aspergillus egyptiacus]
MSRSLSLASKACGPQARPLLSSMTLRPTSIAQARPNSGLAQDWKGSGQEKHATTRSKKEHDNTDPETIAANRTREDREENFGVGGTGISDAATERGGRKNEREVKKDHPKAPEPVIGMNDERAQKGV